MGWCRGGKSAITTRHVHVDMCGVVFEYDAINAIWMYGGVHISFNTNVQERCCAMHINNARGVLDTFKWMVVCNTHRYEHIDTVCGCV